MHTYTHNHTTHNFYFSFDSFWGGRDGFFSLLLLLFLILLFVVVGCRQLVLMPFCHCSSHCSKHFRFCLRIHRASYILFDAIYVIRAAHTIIFNEMKWAMLHQFTGTDEIAELFFLSCVLSPPPFLPPRVPYTYAQKHVKHKRNQKRLLNKNSNKCSIYT